ncbi:MAG: hypothetical protein ACHQM4_07245, partial [Thermoanaerobaculia bacterium]
MEGEKGERRSATLLVLTVGGAASGSAVSGSAAALTPGDVLVWTSTALPAPSMTGPPSLEEICRTSPERGRHIRRDDLGGRPVPGITGLRTLVELPEARLAGLRLGPPPTARWVFRGVRAIAVFSGKITLVDGEEAKL